MWAPELCPPGPRIPSSPGLHTWPEQGRYLQLLDGASDVVHVEGVDDDGRRGEEEEEEEEEGVDCDEAGPPVEVASGQVFPGEGWGKGTPLGPRVPDLRQSPRAVSCRPVVGPGCPDLTQPLGLDLPNRSICKSSECIAWVNLAPK